MTRSTIVPLFAFALAAMAATGCSSSQSAKSTDGATQTALRWLHIEGDHIETDKKIHFATDSDVILDDSQDILDEMAALLKENEAQIVSLKIIGHTDATGDAAHNKELSERRAAAVKAALEARGVSQQLHAAGLGEEALVCTEESPACHEQNRRVEFVIQNAG